MIIRDMEQIITASPRLIVAWVAKHWEKMIVGTTLSHGQVRRYRRQQRKKKNPREEGSRDRANEGHVLIHVDSEVAPHSSGLTIVVICR